MFDYWADLIVYLLVQWSSMVDAILDKGVISSVTTLLFQLLAIYNNENVSNLIN